MCAYFPGKRMQSVLMSGATRLEQSLSSWIYHMPHASPDHATTPWQLCQTLHVSVIRRDIDISLCHSSKFLYFNFAPAQIF